MVVAMHILRTTAQLLPLRRLTVPDGACACAVATAAAARQSDIALADPAFPAFPGN
ncbi:MAG TPA: hypothetical protein VKZ48_00030 [Burkholderiales bacterium]|nr:hypothetical protein [Burkholderiales bacterium]